MMRYLPLLLSLLATTPALAFESLPMSQSGLPPDLATSLSEFGLRGPVRQVVETYVRKVIGPDWSYSERQSIFTVEFDESGYLTRQTRLSGYRREQTSFQYDTQRRVSHAQTATDVLGSNADRTNDDPAQFTRATFSYPAAGQVTISSRNKKGEAGCVRYVQVEELMLKRMDCGTEQGNLSREVTYFRRSVDRTRVEVGGFRQMPATLAALRKETPAYRTLYHLRDGRVIRKDSYLDGALTHRRYFERDELGEVLSQRTEIPADPAGALGANLPVSKDKRPYDSTEDAVQCKRTDIRRDAHDNAELIVERCESGSGNSDDIQVEYRSVREYQYY